MQLDVQLKLKDILHSPNIAEKLDAQTLSHIGTVVVQEFENDLASRAGWEENMSDALKLAMQITEDKTFPWPGASNVKFPLITVAALQYHARAYPALIQGTNLVKCRVIGEDADGTRTARAKRIETHMAYQLLEEDYDWEEEMDKTLLVQSIMGCAFKKVFYDPIKGHSDADLVLPKDLVVSYYTKSFDDSRRYTHVIEMSKNDLIERERRKLYCTGNESLPSPRTPSGLDVVRDEEQGMTPPARDESQPYEILEQHRWLDLDGDGYEEPYVVTVRRDTKEVKRIVARFYSDGITYDNQEEIKILERTRSEAMANKDVKKAHQIESQIEKLKDKGLVVSIKPECYFTRYTFIPSPDGGFYGMGWGLLLGPTNKSIDTLINQLIDSTTLSITAGGFLGRGAKLRKGDNSFRPFEWKPVDSVGDDLRKNVFPLPVREPSAVAFQLLQLLINYGERIGMSVDILTGQNPGQNTPAETSRTMVEQGMKIFSGIYKRTYRSLKDEFQKFYRLNQLFLQDDRDYENLATGQGAKVLMQDYLGNPTDVRPAADPEVVSRHERQVMAGQIAQRAMQIPGYNKYLAEKTFLESLGVANIDALFPDPQGPKAVPPPPNIKMEEAQLKLKAKQMDAQVKLQIAAAQLMQQSEVNRAKIHQMEADVILKLKSAGGIDTGHEIALLNAQIGAAKQHQQGILESVKLMHDLLKGMQGNDSTSGMEGMEPASGNGAVLQQPQANAGQPSANAG